MINNQPHKQSSKNDFDRLLSAVKKNNYEDFCKAIDNEGISVNSENETNNTVLFHVENSTIKFAQKLIQSKIKLDHQNIVGQTALHFAVMRKNKEIVELLVKAGAKTDIKNNFNMTPKDFACGIPELIEKLGIKETVQTNESLDQCRELCQNIFSEKSFVDNIMAFLDALPNNKKQHLLESLSNTKNHIQEAEKKRQNTEIPFTDQEKFSYLFFRLNNDEKELYPELLDIILICAQSEAFHKSNRLFSLFGMQAFSPFLIFMLKTSNAILLEKLAKMENFNPNEQNNQWGNTYLLFLVSNAQSEASMNFIDILSGIDKTNRCGLNVNVLSTAYGTAPLHLAIAKGYRDCDSEKKPVRSFISLVEKLIQAGGDVNLKTSKFLDALEVGSIKKSDTPSEQTPLHIAAARRDKELIEILMQNGADNQLTNAQNQTPQEVFELSFKERKKIVDGICGHNNFKQYEKEHSDQDHIEGCRKLLTFSRKSLRM